PDNARETPDNLWGWTADQSLQLCGRRDTSHCKRRAKPQGEWRDSQRGWRPAHYDRKGLQHSVERDGFRVQPPIREGSAWRSKICSLHSAEIYRSPWIRNQT